MLQLLRESGPERTFLSTEAQSLEGAGTEGLQESRRAVQGDRGERKKRGREGGSAYLGLDVEREGKGRGSAAGGPGLLARVYLYWPP